MAAITMLKARWDFAGEQADDLPLKKGEIITLVSQHDSGWWKGRNAAGREGNFPSNYVKPVATPPLPARREEKREPVAARAAESRRLSDVRGSVRLRASLRCKGLAVTAATRQPVPHEDGHLRTFYLIELTTETGKKSFMKRYHEVCNLHAQMLSFFPDLQFSVDLRAPALNTNKRQIDVIGARKAAIQEYLRCLLGEPNAVSLMLGWLVPGEKLKVGVSTPTPAAAPAPAPAPAPAAAEPDTASYPDAAAACMVEEPGFTAGKQCAFSLDSLDAFDDLIAKHYSIVECKGEDGAKPRVGQMVELSYTALVWDGATTCATEFRKLSKHVFQLGDRSLVPVPPGLHAAIAEVCVGQTATVVLDPDAGFAEGGFPPHVPELAHLVYTFTLVAVTGAPDDSVTLRPAADRSGGKALPRLVGAASTAGQSSVSTAELEERFSAHVGDIPTRASFAPHAGRSKKDAMKVEKQRPSTLAAVDEASESGAGGAGAGAGTPGGGSTPHARTASGGSARGKSSTGVASPRVPRAQQSPGSNRGGLMGELARESARRASTRNFSGVAATSSPRGGAPAAEEPQHTGTMTLDQVRAIRQQAAPDQDLERLEMLLSREEFIRVFGMKVSEFRALPEFRRRALKIKAKLHVPNKKKRGT